MIIDVSGIKLIPGNRGKECPGSWEFADWDCCCDECDYIKRTDLKRGFSRSLFFLDKGFLWRYNVPIRYGSVAQLGERTVRIREVRGFDPLQIHQKTTSFGRNLSFLFVLLTITKCAAR